MHAELSWIPPGVPGAIETDAYAFDPEKARQALAASSYGGPEGSARDRLVLRRATTRELRRATWLADQFRQVLGVELTLRPVTWDEIEAMQAETATWPQMANTYWWNGLPDPHGWLSFWTCGAEQFAVHVGYCNPEYDALVAQSDRELDPAARIRLAQESHRLLHRRCARGFRIPLGHYLPGEAVPHRLLPECAQPGVAGLVVAANGRHGAAGIAIPDGIGPGLSPHGKTARTSRESGSGGWQGRGVAGPDSGARRQHTHNPCHPATLTTDSQ